MRSADDILVLGARQDVLPVAHLGSPAAAVVPTYRRGWSDWSCPRRFWKGTQLVALRRASRARAQGGKLETVQFLLKFRFERAPGKRRSGLNRAISIRP